MHGGRGGGGREGRRLYTTVVPGGGKTRRCLRFDLVRRFDKRLCSRFIPPAGLGVSRSPTTAPRAPADNNLSSWNNVASPAVFRTQKHLSTTWDGHCGRHTQITLFGPPPDTEGGTRPATTVCPSSMLQPTIPPLTLTPHSPRDGQHSIPLPHRRPSRRIFQRILRPTVASSTAPVHASSEALDFYGNLPRSAGPRRPSRPHVRQGLCSAYVTEYVR